MRLVLLTLLGGNLSYSSIVQATPLEGGATEEPSESPSAENIPESEGPPSEAPAHAEPSGTETSAPSPTEDRGTSAPVRPSAQAIAVTETPEASMRRIAGERRKAMLEYELGEYPAAHLRLRAAIQQCTARRAKCDKMTLAVLWRDLGIVLAGGLKKPEPAVGAFRKALKYYEAIAVPKQYLSPTVQSAYRVAGGRWAPTAGPEESRPFIEAEWAREDAPEKQRSGGLFEVGYVAATGFVLGIASGGSAVVPVIKQRGNVELLFPIKDGSVLAGAQLRGGALHSGTSFGLITSTFGGASFVGAQRWGKSREGITTVALGFDFNGTTPWFAAEARVGACLDPFFLGFGGEFQLGGAQGVVMYGVQLAAHFGIALDL